MEKRWFLKGEVDGVKLEKFRNDVKCDPVLARLLVQRGIDTYAKANEFFNPSLTNLHDPFEMKNMNEAVARLSRALDANERIMLYGDYDVDGTTAVALMYSFLKKYAVQLDYYIPDRYTEGYGISRQGIDHAAKQGVQLLISLDCGIRAVELIEHAKENQIDVIVCDHHEPGEALPDCIVLDPKQAECAYPYKGLSGCGVGFKLLQGLCLVKGIDVSELYDYLDLVAVSIGADIVDITGENRILAYAGLERLNKSPRIAFNELVKIAGKEFPVSLTDIVFTIAPRINAAGRLRSGRFAVMLMTSNDKEEIEKIAVEIDQDNQHRRELDKRITQEAISLIEADERYQKSKSLVVYDPGWHKGVVGIVASRIMERFFKPTIVLTKSNEKITGSARTVNNFDVHGAISECGHFLEQFGGHCHAAGLTMPPENLDKFRDSFERVVSETISSADLAPSLNIDLEIELSDLFKVGKPVNGIPALKRHLLRFEPHGPGNHQPVFLSTNVYSVDSTILKEEHLRIRIIDPKTNCIVPAIAFNMANKADLIASGIPFDIAYTIEINRWKGKESIQLNVRDIRATMQPH